MQRQFTKGLAARLTFYPPEGLIDDGDATVEVLSAAGAVIIEEEAVEQATAAATTTALGQRGDVDLVVSDTTGITRGMRLLLISPSGKRCEVVVDGITAGVGAAGTVHLQWGLVQDAPTGSILRDWSLALALTSTDTATVRRNARVRWTYEVDGQAVRWEETFDVVPRPFALPLTEADLRAEAPDWGDFSGLASRWQQTLDAALDDVDKLLRRNGVYPDRILDRTTLKGAVINAFLARLYLITSSPRAADFTAALNADIASLSGATNGYDLDDDGNVSSGEQGLVPGGGRQMRMI